MHLRIFTLLFCLLACGVAGAQTANASTELSENETTLRVLTDQNWSVYADEDNQLFYIDFQNLTINISDIIVRDDAGMTIMKDDVFDLPVDTIYELDLSTYEPGKYEIELRSFTGIIKKTVDIK